MTKRLLLLILGSTLVACGSDDGPGFDEPQTPAAGQPGAQGSGKGSGSADAGTGTDPGAGADAGAGPAPTSDAGGRSADGGGGGYDTPTVCTSGTTWTGGDRGDALMHPGVACDTCHKILGSATKFPFDIGGTVYPTAHEPDDCNGVTGAQVIVTDANGTDHTLAVNAAGNFYNLNYLGVGAISTPYTAKVVANGKTRAMLSSQTVGDCNTCHDEKGTQAAPGRIMMP